ncbi:MAG: hypothetical protein ACOYMS_12105 [Terrimicrobiaceae bacterium]
MRRFLLLPVLLGLALTASAADYGQKVEFAKSRTLAFPDCELVFLGQRRVASPVFKPGFTFYDFRVTSGGETKTVSWSSGTGEIGPALFEIAGKRFLLELKASEASKGWLKENELVLWRDRIKQ